MKKISGFIFAIAYILSFSTLVYAEDISVSPPEIIPSTETSENPEPVLEETFIIRNGDSLIYQGTALLPDEGNDRSVLAVLKSIDESSDAFSISNIQDFSFGKYLKCIVPNSGTELCDYWQFAVGSFTPFTSIDTTLLSGGETVGIYFGNSHQLVLSTNAITAGGSLDATAQKYDYENNIWNPLIGVNVGVTLPNPDDQWNPIVVSTHPVDALGIANITIASANTYTLGIAEDFYFPSYPVTVSVASSGGGGGGHTIITPTFDPERALAYLESTQATDGSFGGSDLYTDWAGIALGALNVTDNSRDTLLSYFNSHNIISSLLTDNERHAMALLALGQNPYSFKGVNYIDAIINSFDGAQFGDANLVNDDIFALIPLKNSGYTASDDIIIKDVAFIISAQNPDGSWDESVDMTATAVQALKSFESVAGVSDALSKAKEYLTDTQSNDGGWGNVSSTSWAMQAMGALGESWEKDGHTPSDYLAGQQTEDGAVSPLSEILENRIWATSYAVTASSLKPWSAIMQSVSKPVIQKTISLKKDTKISAVSKTKKTTTLLTLPTLKKVGAPTPENVGADTLTALAINTLPAQTGLPTQTIPIALGVLFGIIILYFVAKFFIL